ncbi:MAG: aminopeptidase [Verrucomicrobiota bacterium]
MISRIILSILTLCLASCSTVDFYRQAVAGQWEVLRKRRDNAEVAADPMSAGVLKEQLAKAANMRRFATRELALPGHAAYGKYADLRRDHLVWVIYAAPEFSLEAKTWFYPFVGKLDYRGYFAEADAEEEVAKLRADGYDVFVGGVDAFSTLGVFHDPLLNTFIGYPDIHLAETIFHELTHHRIFKPGDTEYNECLANVVAEEGVKRWLAAENRTADLRKYETLIVRRAEFQKEIDAIRAELKTLYASEIPLSEMRRRKEEIFRKLRDDVRELHRKWGARISDGWLKGKIHNGHLASLHMYAARMPEFRKVLAESGGDFETFFRRIERMRGERWQRPR